MVELASLNNYGLKMTAKTSSHKNTVTITEDTKIIPIETLWKMHFGSVQQSQTLVLWLFWFIQ